MKNTNYGFITKIRKKLLGLSVYADGDVQQETQTDPTPAQTVTTSTINFEDLIAKARKEEKEKLYPQINSLKEEVAKITEKYNKALLTIEELKEEKANLEKTITELKNASNKSDDEKVKALNKEIEQLKKEIERLQEEKDKVNPQEIEERIRNEYEVKLYREKVIREAVEKNLGIIPELITGTTKEEIDASLELSKKRYEEIINKVVSSSSMQIPPVNTNISKVNTKDFSLEDLVKLDPRSQEYKELRKKLGLK